MKSTSYKKGPEENFQRVTKIPENKTALQGKYATCLPNSSSQSALEIALKNKQ
jgi:hypothetical protein